MADHEHIIGPSDNEECACGAIHLYCETCMKRMTSCPIYDAPEALRQIFTLVRNDSSELGQEIADIAGPIVAPDERQGNE